MINSKVIIADEDENYIIPLQFKFVNDFFNKIDLEMITEREYFNEYFSKPQTAEILIISDRLYDPSIQRHNIQSIFVLTEQHDEGGTGDLNITQLYKYTSIKEIFDEIIGKSAGILNMESVEKRETQVVLVTSAAGGVGKTTIAMGISACWAQNYKRVLYINASRLQNFRSLLDNKTALSSPEVYTKLLNPQGENIYQDLSHVIRREGFSYVPPFKASLQSLGLDFTVFKKIILSAKKSREYDYIVVDVENTFDVCYMELIDLADKVIIITTQTKQSVSHTNFWVANVNGVNTEKYIFICNNFNAERENALIRPEMDIKFTVENYIDHISFMESKHVSDYAKVQGIRKTALLVT